LHDDGRQNLHSSLLTPSHVIGKHLPPDPTFCHTERLDHFQERHASALASLFTALVVNITAGGFHFSFLGKNATRSHWMHLLPLVDGRIEHNMWLELTRRTNLRSHSKTASSRVVRFALHGAGAQLNHVVLRNDGFWQFRGEPPAA